MSTVTRFAPALEGRLRIARHLSAGTSGKVERVPEGRLKPAFSAAMTRFFLWSALATAVKRQRAVAEDYASQIAEFAVALPLLVLFVVGIFDFSGAITLKQKLTNAAREGARVAAADPANDLVNTGTPLPVSVVDAFWVVDNYLESENIVDGVNQCQLKSALPAYTSGLTWVSTATGCPGGPSNALVLTIDRGYVTQETVGANTIYVVNTQVTIRYPYSWQFSGVSGLFGGVFTGPSGISTTAVAFNEN